jgi:hypothetical protein
MSPSESELRSFLHGGEGDPIDPDALIAHARGVRHNRRVRLASVAAAVIAVGAVGTGTLVLSGGNSATSSADRQANVPPNLQSQATDAPGLTHPVLPKTNTSPGSGEEACPAIPLRLMLPGGGGTGQFGGDAPLFDGTVSSMQICGYAAASLSGQVAFSDATVLTGDQANEIATSLNAASTTRVIRHCPIRQTRELIIYATSQSGATMKPVVVDYSSCAPFATNGTAARYDWVPPKDVGPTLTDLMTPNPALPSVPGGKSFEPTGSPVR